MQKSQTPTRTVGEIPGAAAGLFLRLDRRRKAAALDLEKPRPFRVRARKFLRICFGV